ncbi:MAG: hypothetical protein HW383_26 [Candidatus Magasanikbacteria bacterium]|nr:hypothetical protein [Candidatus Magasanikbacteria bacterium]
MDGLIFKNRRVQGFSLIEVILGLAVLALMMTTIITLVVWNTLTNSEASRKSVAVSYALEGLEAARQIRDQSFAYITPGNHGVTTSTGQWAFSGASNSLDGGNYVRTVRVNLVDADRAYVTSSSTYPSITGISREVALASYLNNWPRAQNVQVVFVGDCAVGNDVYVSGNYLYVAINTAGGGLLIFDVTDPQLPSSIATVNVGGKAKGVHVSGNYAYVAVDNASAGLAVVDVTNPATPSLVATLNIGNIGNGIFVSGNYAYIAQNSVSGGLVVINITNPLAPSLAATVDVQARGNRVFIDGNYAYVSVASAIKGLAIVNVTAPTAPVYLNSTNVGAFGTGIYVAGGYAYVSAASNSNGLAIVNVSNPLAPSLTAQVDVQGSGQGVYLDGTGHAYVGVASQTKGLGTVTVTDPTNPSFLLSNDLDPATDGTDTFVSGNYVYISSSNNNHCFAVNNIIL